MAIMGPNITPPWGNIIYIDLFYTETLKIVLLDIIRVLIFSAWSALFSKFAESYVHCECT